MFVTIINDCHDANAAGRQLTRIGSLIEASPTFVAVQSDFEAGVQLIDMLDAAEGRPGLILVNVAPRGGHTTKWENGTPFAYFWYEKTLVVTSVDGYALSAAKKFLGLNEVHIVDTNTASEAMRTAGFITGEASERIPKTQFRSFEFTPHIGVFLLQGNELPRERYSLENIPDLPPAIWHIDNFGNCKTTLTNTDMQDQTELKTKFGTLPVITHLRDVPDESNAVVIGSSGLKQTRFAEIVSQRKNFALHHNARIGDDLTEDRNYCHPATT